MPAEKRKRSVNFSTEEKMRFLRILQQRGKVIIHKVNSHDLHTNRMKEDAWTEIMEVLNETGGIQRSKDTLKKLWQKMKTEVRSLSQTNVNPDGEPRFDDPALEVVADIIGYGGTYTGLEAVYDESQLCIKQERNPAKKQWPSDPNRITVPTEEEMANKLRVSSNYRFEHERLRCEREKSALIELQREHMTKEHEQKVRQGEIKTQILEAVLKKIQDEKPVDAELLKIVSTL